MLETCEGTFFRLYVSNIPIHCFLNGQHLQQIPLRSRLSPFEVASTGTASREQISQELAVIVVAVK